MGGCTNCKGKSGCDDRKGAMFDGIDDILARVYPTRTWGEPDESAAFDHAPTADEIADLADELATALTAATFVERGTDEDPCDYIWILCMGRTPCVIGAFHGAAPPDTDVDELYLRVCVSTRARVAGVQQVAVTLRDGVVDIRPRAGVYDAPLLHRMQKLVAILPAYDLLHVDFGDIAHAPPGYAAGDWAALYGGEPAIANYLFFPQPATMATQTVLP